MTPGRGVVALLIDLAHREPVAALHATSEGMTDSPHLRGLSTTGHRHWRRTRPEPPQRRSRTDSLSPPRTACAARHRRQGPTAASRSGPHGPDPGPRCLTRRCPKTGGERTRKDQRQEPGVDRTRFFRDDRCGQDPDRIAQDGTGTGRNKASGLVDGSLPTCPIRRRYQK